MMQQKALVSDTSVHMRLPSFSLQFIESLKESEKQSLIHGLLREERAAGSSLIRVNMEEVLAPLREAVREQVRYSDTSRNNY